MFASDPQAEANVVGPRRRALDAYNGVLDRLHLDGLVYPATQVPPPDETMPQDGKISEGPHSAMGWVNMIGVPAVVVPGGFYPDGLPLGLELSARPLKDGAYSVGRMRMTRQPGTAGRLHSSKAACSPIQDDLHTRRFRQLCAIPEIHFGP